jgi:uncharacterized protein YutE (UPF0331/DUF86 family)
MNRFDPEIIAQKLGRMLERIDRLKKFEQLTLEEYLQDNLRQAAIERLIEIVIDSALSINKTLLKRVAGIVPPETSKSFKNFDSLRSCTILNKWVSAALRAAEIHIYRSCAERANGKCERCKI